MGRFPQKLLVPSTARATVERPEQRALLDRTIGAHRATILAAPAGWGKTTLLAEWAQAATLPIAWYALDATDRDPYQLLDYLLTAVSPFVPGAAELARRLPHARHDELAVLMREAAALIADAEQDFALILDDLHLVTDGGPAPPAAGLADVTGLLATLIDYAAPCHLVLASRTLPKSIPGLARAVAQQRVAVLDYLALQWSGADIQRLGASYAVPMSDAQAAALGQRYNGWIVGIVLALDSAARQPAAGDVAGAEDTGQVYAFFAEQIVAPLPAEHQRFLEETSVLDDLSPQRCDQLCQRNDSAMLLDELVARGLFLSRRGPWLSYHSLFRDFLRTRLARDSARERELLERAATIYAAEDELERAVACLCAARAFERACALLSDAVPRYRQQARQTTLLRCFELLQEQAGRSAPYHLPPDLLLAQARVYGDLALWERAYVALRLVELTGATAQHWEARLIYAGLLAIQGDLEQAKSILAQTPPAEDLPPELRLEARFTRGRVAMLSGQLGEGIGLLEAALRDGATAKMRPEVLAASYDLLGYGHALRHNIGEAMRCLQRADAYWELSGDSARRAITLNNIAVLALDEGRLPDARSALTTALVLAQASGRRREEESVRLTLGDLALAEGQLAEAGAQFAAAYELAQQTQVRADRAAAAAGAAFIAALSGEAAAARLWLERLPDTGLPGSLVGRAALARALLPREVGARGDRQTWLDQAAAAGDAIGPVERLALDLLRADEQLRAGQANSIDWMALDLAATATAEPLLRALLQPHTRLLEAAPPSSALARRLERPQAAPRPVRWAVAALGHFACHADGQPCELSPLHRALLVRLLDAGPGGLSVERLWEDVWGDSHLSMSALHKALSRLREQTGLATSARSGHCGIYDDWAQISYDVQAFERALADPDGSAGLKRALESYQGDFLPGAAPSAQAWVDQRRTYLQQRYLAALEQLANLLEGEEPERAIALYQRALQVDRSREQTAARLMSLAARRGNHALVSATFAQLSEALHSLGLTPLQSTISLYQHLR